MGKDEEDQTPGFGGAASSSEEENEWGPVRSCRKCVTWRCAAVLLFGLAVLLSAVFWLPPFDTWHHRTVGPGTDGIIEGESVVAFKECGLIDLRFVLIELLLDLALPDLDFSPIGFFFLYEILSYFPIFFKFFGPVGFVGPDLKIFFPNFNFNLA